MVSSLRRKEQRFEERRALRIVYGLLLAVRHLKAHGIIHRDVKLDNVLLANVGTEHVRFFSHLPLPPFRATSGTRANDRVMP